MYHDKFRGKGYQQVAQYGAIYAQTDRPHYYAGEQVTGNIYLDLKQPYPGYDVYLKLKGKERTLVIIFKKPENGRVEEEKIERQEASCLYEKVIVHTFPRDQSLLAGQYQFPFSFKLPENIPGTFHQHEFGLSASITYTIEAFFEPDKALLPKLKYKHRFVVRELARQKIRQVNVASRTRIDCTPCKCCCSCKSYGFVELKVSSEKDTYSPSEQAKAIIQVDNSNCSTFVALTSQVRQSLNVRANSKEQNRENLFAEDAIGGAGAGEMKTCLYSVTLPPAPNLDIIFLKGHEHLKNREAYLNKTINSATNGTLIQSEFYLEVQALSNGYDTNIPTISAPIHIVYPDYGFPVIRLPPNWQPQVMSAFNFAPNMNSNYVVKSKPNNNLMPGGMIQGNVMGTNTNSDALQPSSLAIQQGGYLGAQELQQQELQLEQQLQQQELQLLQEQQPQHLSIPQFNTKTKPQFDPQPMPQYNQQGSDLGTQTRDLVPQQNDYPGTQPRDSGSQQFDNSQNLIQIQKTQQGAPNKV